MLSKYQLMIFNDFFKKLMPNVFVKENYMLHYENLQLQLKLALKIKKIHLILEFNQSQWHKPYVEFDTKQKIRSRKN